MVTFETLQRNDPIVEQFRKEISRIETDSEYVFWFSDEKFNNINFRNLELCLIDGKAISISGCTVITIDGEQCLRIAQLHYTLPEHRVPQRDMLIKEGGFFDRHLLTANGLGLNKMILSIHVFNEKTDKLDRILKLKRQNYRWLNRLEYIGVHEISNVNQMCYEINLK